MNRNNQGGNPPPFSPLAQSGEAAAKVVPPGYMAGDQVSPSGHPDMHPGDELPPGAPNAGENICYNCNGRGRLAGGSSCELCGGTGKIIESVAGGP